MNLDSRKPLKILIVEDDEDSRTLLQVLVSESSLPIDQVKSAESLDVAFQLLEENNFDVVLLDLDLPDSKGLDTLLRVSKKCPGRAIIVITGEYDEDFGPKAIAMGAHEYLIKGKHDKYMLSKSIEYAVERKRTHEIIDRKQKNLEAIFDAVSIGMLLIDENMIVRRVNDAVRQMVRREYLQIINHPFGSALGCVNSTYNEKGCGYSPACGACPLRKAVKTVLDSEQAVNAVQIQPTLIVSNEKITPWLCINAVPAAIDGRRHVVVAINDITERRRTEEKLKETMEIKSQFISTVSHELRTPLACLKEAVAIVLDGVAGQINDKQRNFLDMAKRNIDRLARLINDVLDFQKLDSGKMKFNIRDNDVTEVIGEVYETMVPYAKEKCVHFSLELKDNLPRARFDSDKIIQILANLVDNAIKFTPEHGHVSVCAQHQGQDLVIRIRDTGMGIPKEALPKIFDRFYRVNRPGKQIQGSGLGLPIVKKIVTMHGGRIEVESKPDQGTTFTVFLPLDSKPIPEVSPVEADEILENSLADN